MGACAQKNLFFFFMSDGLATPPLFSGSGRAAGFGWCGNKKKLQKERTQEAKRGLARGSGDSAQVFYSIALEGLSSGVEVVECSPICHATCL